MNIRESLYLSETNTLQKTRERTPDEDIAKEEAIDEIIVRKKACEDERMQMRLYRKIKKIRILNVFLSINRATVRLLLLNLSLDIFSSTLEFFSRDRL